MSLKARDAIAPNWYTPKAEEGSPSPARFKIRPLNSLEWLDAMREVTRLQNICGERFTYDGQAIRSIVGPALLDWEGVTNGEAKAKFTRRPEADLARIDWPILCEIAEEIIARSRLDEGDEKNS